jgi:signal transduction histidine kinase
LASRLLALRHLAHARLSRRIVWSVFASIVLIEALILLPSIYRRQQELLSHLKDISAAETSGALRMLSSGNSDQQVLARLQTSIQNPAILGGGLYRMDGSKVGTFGEMPQLSFAAVQADSQATLYQGDKYDAAWAIAPLEGQYVLIIRHNAASVQPEILAFIGRIAGLVVIIAIFVTLATLIVLEPLLITPIMLLRRDLLNAGAAISQDRKPPQFDSLALARQDELGEVIAAFDQMYQQVSEAIAQRKQAESNLARLAEVGELAAMIVHEVRNPLTTVLMGLHSFETMDLSAAAQLRLQLALEEAERLQRLLNEILEYSKCQKLNATEIDLNVLITEMLETIRAMPSAQDRQVQFVSAQEPAVILGDRDKLKQVFINLVGNACEAIGKNEIVTWSIDHFESEVTMRIHNGGNPIPADLIEQITQPFFTTKSSGNGLGLAIVKRIVEAHGGRLAIESAHTTGTIVEVKIPIAPASSYR